MEPRRMSSLVVLLVAAVAGGVVAEVPQQGGGDESPRGAGLLADLRSMYSLYRECSGSASCLKLKLIASLDRAARSADLNVLEGIHLVKIPGKEPGQPLSEAQIEASLPRSLGDKEEALDNLIQDKAMQFVDTHTIQVKLSDLDFGRGVEEGRGKKKRTLTTLLMMWLMMAGTLIPIKLGTLAILAGKALIISKLALALAAIVGLKKLLSSGDDHEPSYQVVQVPHHGHRRNLDASDLAYRGYAASKMAQS